MTNSKQPGYLVDARRLPAQYPTHRIAAAFWEQLGRTVATFGFLEETLGKAIFSLSATRRYHESEIDQAYEELFPKIERALSDPLGNLIDSYQPSSEVCDQKPCLSSHAMDRIMAAESSKIVL